MQRRREHESGSENARNHSASQTSAGVGGWSGVRSAGLGDDLVRPVQGQDQPRHPEAPRKPTGWKAGGRHRNHADPSGGGQDHERHQPDPGARAHRDQRGALSAAALDRAIVRYQGRWHRRRHGADRPHGGNQSPLHRRHPCRGGGAQPPGGRYRCGHLSWSARGRSQLHHVTADALRVAGAMTVLLKDALLPNIVQTMEGQPALVHAGPFGNIAHGNNSLLADQIALKLADIVVTEAGFGADLGLEKFAHIVARYGHLKPSAALVVATVRALKSHGGVPLAKLGNEDLDALKRGAENLAAHIDIVRTFGMRSVVAINRFPEDTDRELRLLTDLAEQFGADAAVVNDGFSRGGEGSVELAEAVLAVTKDGSNFAPLYASDTPIREQIQTLARRLYGAADVEFLPECQKRIDWLTERGMGTLPVCMSKTHLSLSHNPTLKGRPLGFTLPVRNVYPSAGAGFVVALAGDIQLMPGLGKEPAYTRIDIDSSGRINGLT